MDAQQHGSGLMAAVGQPRGLPLRLEAPRKGRAVATRSDAKNATRNLLCRPVPPRRSPDTTSLRLSAGSQVGVKVSKIYRQQRSEAFSLPIPRPSQISLDKLITL